MKKHTEYIRAYARNSSVFLFFIVADVFSVFYSNLFCNHFFEFIIFINCVSIIGFIPPFWPPMPPPMPPIDDSICIICAIWSMFIELCGAACEGGGCTGASVCESYWVSSCTLMPNTWQSSAISCDAKNARIAAAYERTPRMPCSCLTCLPSAIAFTIALWVDVDGSGLGVPFWRGGSDWGVYRGIRKPPLSLGAFLRATNAVFHCLIIILCSSCRYVHISCVKRIV